MEPKKRKVGRPAQPEAVRKQKPMAFRPSPELRQRIEEYLEKTWPKVTAQAFFEAATLDFLASQEAKS